MSLFVQMFVIQQVEPLPLWCVSGSPTSGCRARAILRVGGDGGGGGGDEGGGETGHGHHRTSHLLPTPDTGRGAQHAGLFFLS